MKFRVMLKDPDTLDEAISDSVRERLSARDELSPKEREALFELSYDECQEVAERWFQYGEYLTIEIDTSARTCRVVPSEELL